MRARFSVIQQIEQQLPLAAYEAEWQLLQEDKSYQLLMYNNDVYFLHSKKPTMKLQNSYDRITFSLPHSMNLALDELKEELQSTKSDLIKQAIEYFIRQQEERKLQQTIKLMAKEYENNEELTYLTVLDAEDFQ